MVKGGSLVISQFSKICALRKHPKHSSPGNQLSLGNLAHSSRHGSNVNSISCENQSVASSEAGSISSPRDCSRPHCPISENFVKEFFRPLNFGSSARIQPKILTEFEKSPGKCSEQTPDYLRNSSENTHVSGDEEARTLNPLLAKQVLSQLSYIPKQFAFRKTSCSESGSPSTVRPHPPVSPGKPAGIQANGHRLRWNRLNCNRFHSACSAHAKIRTWDLVVISDAL